jgi:hypothetical protein
VKKHIRLMTNEDLFDYFKQVSGQATITPFADIELKKNDSKNVKTLKAYHRAIGNYVGCIQELRRRGYTLWEVMEILK